MPEFKNILLITITGVGLYIGYVYINKNSNQSIAPPVDDYKPPMDKVQPFLKTSCCNTTPPTTTPVNNTLQKKLIDDFLKGTTSINSVIPNKLPSQPVDNFLKIGSTAPITTLSSVQAPPMPVSVNKINLFGLVKKN